MKLDNTATGEMKSHPALRLAMARHLAFVMESLSRFIYDDAKENGAEGLTLRELGHAIGRARAIRKAYERYAEERKDQKEVSPRRRPGRTRKTAGRKSTTNREEKNVPST